MRLMMIMRRICRRYRKYENMAEELTIKCNDILEEENQYAKHSMREIFDWLGQVEKDAEVCLSRISLEECRPWMYDRERGEIRNGDGSFFQITGIRQYFQGQPCLEQPIIIQDEIGFLGILCCKIQGVWHYLMQAKIEPGNVNVVQISPTIQATKSNFLQKHGGSVPKFLEYFLHMKTEDILVDQLQSEQSSRFLKKRNRNVILMVQEELPELSSHRWLTLRQIKELMHYENLVNMDTRTVLACIPYVLLGHEGDVPFQNKPYFYKTAWSLERKTIVEIYHEINNKKMFDRYSTKRVPLHELESWEMKEDEVVCRQDYAFKVIYCDININGREVKHWRQPLLCANGHALFGLLCCDDEGVLKFLVRIKNEVGCMDGVELGPTVQEEPYSEEEKNDISVFFREKLQRKEGVVVDVMLSEEGGRFYQEQNRNVIIKVESGELDSIPNGYIWSDYGTLNLLTQINNCLNIQLRNLLSLLEI